MPGSDVLVQIALGLAVIGAAVLVLRWAWNSRKREGGTEEKAAALERAVVEADERETQVRAQRRLSHGEWKKQGKKRRATRPGPRKR